MPVIRRPEMPKNDIMDQKLDETSNLELEIITSREVSGQTAVLQ